ncbi:MAG: FAD-dependent oxidoreductase [Verrucomicrobia bacterium]|nr:FAD-dependent oxidoreductase [Verrucomicrobiota bacterium]
MKMKAIYIGISLASLLFANEPLDPHKTVIVGGGIVGAVESYYSYLDAQEKGEKIEVVVYEKGPSFPELSSSNTNTSYNIFPSLTTDEILSVVPRGSELIEKLTFLFSEPGGIRVDDAIGVNDSEAATDFVRAVEIYGNDPTHDDRTKNLLMLGRMSMDMWQDLYDRADDELKKLLEESNFNPCRDPLLKGERVLHDGYRIDLIYEVANAESRAQGMKETYEGLGYDQCKILTPGEVASIDPSLADFCAEHSEMGQWNSDCSALWRPGGCISTRVFLPKFYDYLKKIMGQDSFSIQFNKEVAGVVVDSDKIAGLTFKDGTVDLAEADYVFCPGESVGTLKKLGFDEPAYAGFAGPSLTLSIPLTPEQSEKYKTFGHCMEVHKVGIVLAWQARFHEDQIIIGVAGTKAFYGDQQPLIDQNFATNRHLVQLNMVNDVLPEMVSIALGIDTKGLPMTHDHIAFLESQGILNRWVGRRAVAYDGFPTLGALYRQGEKVQNGRCTTHLGSGGVSFAPAAVKMSRSLNQLGDDFTQKILQYADSRRQPK